MKGKCGMKMPKKKAPKKRKVVRKVKKGKGY
jgi:hypothetical protein